MEQNRFAWKVSPVAMAENVVAGEKYRFTVLTPSLIRMEYAPDGIFEDRASQSVFHRDFPKCEFSCTCSDGIIVLQTNNLILTYRENMPFGEETLAIKLKNEPASLWHYGEDFEDLGGTVKTLDTIVGACKLGRGIVSTVFSCRTPTQPSGSKTSVWLSSSTEKHSGLLFLWLRI